MFHNKRVLTIVSTVVLLALVLAGCAGTASSQSSSSFTGYGKVTQVTYTNTVESTGNIAPQHIASLSFSTTGTVAQTNVKVGQEVNTGDILMTLDPTTVPANLQSAQTDLTNAQNALNQLTNPDLNTVANAQASLSNAYTSFQQAQSALTNAIINNQTASSTTLYENWLNAKTALDQAQNNLPLANASIDVQAYFQAVSDASVVQEELAAAEQNANNNPNDTVMAQKVTSLKTAVQNSQTKETQLQAGLSSDVVQLVNTLVDKQNAYDTAAANFIGAVVTTTASSNVNLAQIEADLTSKQSSLLSEQSTLQDQQNKRASMNGARCDASTITDYQNAYDAALQRYERSDHIIGSPQYNAMETAAANLNYCSSDYSAAEIAAQDADIASTQAQIQLLQAQIASDQAQINDAGNAVYSLAISLSTVMSTYQAADQALNNAVTSLYQLEVAPNPEDIAAAQANVQSAQAEVNSLTLTAPFAGEVTQVGFQPGDSVSPSTVAVVLVDRSNLYVDLQIDESQVVELSNGDKATITLEASPNLNLTGKITYINPVGTSTQGVVYYDVQVTVDKADPSILIGATADVVLQAGEPQNVLTVPVTAIGTDSQGEYVDVIGQNNSVQQVTVTSGQILPNNTVIVTGNLTAGETVGLLTNSTISGSNNSTGGGRGSFFGP
jgi:HlyD family secretion protein